MKEVKLQNHQLKGPNYILAYIDGSCLDNPRGPAAAAAILHYRGREKEVSRFLGPGTNNMAELNAVKLALETIKTRTIPVHIYTDSTYVIGMLTKGWNAKKNTKLVKQIKKLMAEYGQIKFIKIKGHSSNRYNNRADLLAKETARKGKSIGQPPKG